MIFQRSLEGQAPTTSKLLGKLGSLVRSSMSFVQLMLICRTSLVFDMPTMDMPTHEHHLPNRSLLFKQHCHLFNMWPHPSNPQDNHPPLLVNSWKLWGITSKDLPPNPHFLIIGMNPKLSGTINSTPSITPLVRKVAEIMEESSQPKANPLHSKV